MGFGDSLSATENREGCKGVVATSSVVPRQPPISGTEMRLDEMGTYELK